MKRLTPQNLAQPSRVLSPSPNWKTALEAKGKLEGDRDDESLLELFDDQDRELTSDERERVDEFNERLKTGQDYVKMFEEYSDALSLILLVAAGIGELASGRDEPADESAEGSQDSDRLYRGVQALRKHVQFGSLTKPDDRLKAVQSFLESSELLSRIVDKDSKITPFEIDRLDAWQKKLEDNLSEVREAARVQKHELLARAQSMAWDRWKGRFDAYLSGHPLRFESQDFDLICDVAEIPPGGLLDPDLSKLYLSGWSEVLIRALRARSDEDADRVPLWAAVPAAVRLNLSWLVLTLWTSASKEGSDWLCKLMSVNGEEVADFMKMVDEHMDRIQQMARENVAFDQVIIITDEQPGMTKPWRIAKEVSALSVNRREMLRMGDIIESMMSLTQGTELPLPDPDYFAVLLDLHPSEKEDFRSLLIEGAHLWQRKIPVRSAVLVNESSEDLPASMQIVAPQNLGQAIQMLHQQVATAKS